MSASCGFATSASASIESTYAFKNHFYTQSSASAPTAARAWEFYAGMDYTDPGDVDTVNLTFSGPASPITLDRQVGGSRVSRFFFTSAAERDAQFPLTTYTYSVTGGTYDGQSGGISMGTNLLPATVPYFTGSTFSALQAVNPATGVSGSINSFSPVAGSNVNFAFVVIFGSGGEYLWNSPQGSDTTFTVPGGLLQPNSQYLIEVIFDSRVETRPAGFNALSIAAFEHRTSTTLRTIPSPASLAILGCFGVATLQRRRTAFGAV